MVFWGCFSSNCMELTYPTIFIIIIANNFKYEWDSFCDKKSSAFFVEKKGMVACPHNTNAHFCCNLDCFWSKYSAVSICLRFILTFISNSLLEYANKFFSNRLWWTILRVYFITVFSHFSSKQVIVF